MTVGEIIGEAIDIHKLAPGKAERADRIKELLRRVGLNTEHANRYPHEFSGGLPWTFRFSPRWSICWRICSRS